MYHLNVHADENLSATENDNIHFNQHDDTVLQDDTTEDLEEGNQLSCPEISGAYTQLAHRSAVLVPPVYESLEDYQLVPEVFNTQRNKNEEYQMSAVQKGLVAEQGLAKALYMNLGQIRKADDYMNVGQISAEEE